MKFIKIIFPILVVASLLFACDKKYEEPMGHEFKGSFIWKYTDTLNKPRVWNLADTMFIEVKSDDIYTYVHAMRDSSLSLSYALSADDASDLRAVSLGAKDTVALGAYPYWASYRFANDTLYVEKYPTKPGADKSPDKTKAALIKSAYVRPGR